MECMRAQPLAVVFKHSDTLDIHDGIMYYYNFIRPKTIAHRLGGSGIKNIPNLHNAVPFSLFGNLAVVGSLFFHGCLFNL